MLQDYTEMIRSMPTDKLSVASNPSPQEAEAEGSEFEESLGFITNAGHSELHCQASFQKIARARKFRYSVCSICTRLWA